MATRTAVPFPTFPPNLLTPPSRRPATEIRFSRWNNANAQPFIRRQREQKEIEDDIRSHRRYESATRIAEDPAAAVADSPATSAEFKSWGTPSSPSRPSIPGKASKYSKPPRKPVNSRNPGSSAASHPAFRRSRISRGAARLPLEAAEERPDITIGENGVSYRVSNAPFEFQYSYTETPKVAPLALREPPVLPFGPSTMPRPWTGRAPLPPSRKKLPEFDSFQPPPPGKKGVKPVQAPGPFLAGSGPKYHAASREEILGDPLTKEEVNDLVKACMKTKRQLNIGRDGLTHNMLDNMHALWKRRRVCKIKCKGVCTVDMDNVRQQLEEKTGGKIIYSRGGVIFLFRGRNYNYKTRPRFPLMLWKPIPPVYPRLVQRVPEGLTLEEATELRKKGRQIPPICKLGKNGVYYRLVKEVKEAFEECELVRINCQGLNKSDTRKIGAKLKDLVPCVLLSFELEHILVWRGKDWESSLPPPEGNSKEATQPDSDPAEENGLLLEVDEDTSDLEGATESSDEDPHLGILGETMAVGEDDPKLEEREDLSPKESSVQCMSSPSEDPVSMHHVITESATSTVHQEQKVEGPTGSPTESVRVPSEGTPFVNVGFLNTDGKDDLSDDGSSSKTQAVENQLPTIPPESEANVGLELTNDLDRRENQLVADSSALRTGISTTESASTSESARTTNLEAESTSTGSQCQDDISSRACLQGVMSLLRQAAENGSAIILGREAVDANIVLERVSQLAKTAPPGPVFRHRIRKTPVQKTEKQEGEEHEKQGSEVEHVSAISKHQSAEKKSEGNSRRREEDIREGLFEMVPHGSLGVDELAKLLR
ncbi:hypothetical protein Taro_056487 [Colocasia esculenta]|uniref:CRM domain-containing protein n=1 Tax=Colocasia esculenta TaxID=4460 RepID=A0A843XWB7_COLES|nr:hypothetical protein [Colocasia esculenta]